MKLRTRLVLGSAVVTAISTLLIGGIAVTSSQKSSIALIDQSLGQVSSSVNAQSNGALSEALLAVRASNLPLTLVHLSQERVATVLVDSTLSIVPKPSLAELKGGIRHPETISGSESYRMRSIKLPENEFIIVAAPLQDIEKRFQSDLVRLATYSIISLLLAGFAIWYLFRRDLRKIEGLIVSATQISNGDTSQNLGEATGDSEVDHLSAALSRMVVSFRHTAELEERSAVKMQEFIGDVSHELRTPLTVIKGYVELLSGSKMIDDFQRVKAYSRVNSEIKRMESLILDILFLAESRETREVEMENFNFSQLLLAHLSDFAALGNSREIASEIESGIFYKGSSLHLARLLTNVFGNISRHTPAEAKVRVSLHESEKKIYLSIEDGGAGLPEEAYSEGIQSFQRFDKSRSREDGGSGLGMSIIFAIVHEHGGTVFLERSELGGLCMRIIL